MRIGIISRWCNRGRGVVARRIRNIFEGAGHETFVLALPTKKTSPIGNHIDSRGVWNVENISLAPSFAPAAETYLNWAAETGVEVVFCDMIVQYDEIQQLRETGVRTIGRFVWESFNPKHVDRMTRAYETIYSLTRCEKGVYASHGIDSPYAHWGISPETFDDGKYKKKDGIYFIFHGGLQGPRKPMEIMIQAFKAVSNPNIRLIIKSQGVRSNSEAVKIADDPRIEHIIADLDSEPYRELYTSCHVSLAPARWEGLGVHLYESIGYGMPVISNDIPPINEVISHGESGLLCKSIPRRVKSNGLQIYDPDQQDLSRCIEELADPNRLAELTKSTRQAAARFSWDKTTEDYLALAEGSLNS